MSRCRPIPLIAATILLWSYAPQRPERLAEADREESAIVAERSPSAAAHQEPAELRASRYWSYFEVPLLGVAVP